MSTGWALPGCALRFDSDTAVRLSEHHEKLCGSALRWDTVLAALQELGFAQTAPAPLRQRETHLDTESLRLFQTGSSLWLATGANGTTLNCDVRGRASDSGFAHTLRDLAWPSSAAPRTARELPAPLDDVIEPVSLLEALEPLWQLELESHRLSTTVNVEETDASVWLRVERRVLAGPSAEHLGELWDFELDAALRRALEPLATALTSRLQLSPGSSTVVERAAELRGLIRSVNEVSFTKKMSARRALAVALTEQRRAVVQSEPGTRLGQEMEDVHAMRVAHRRTAAVLKTLRNVAPESLRRLEPGLKEARRALGPVRDLDVLLETLPELASGLPSELLRGLSRVQGALTRERKKRRSQMLRRLRTRQRLAALQRLDELLAQESQLRTAGPSLRELGPGLVLLRARRALRAAKKLKPSSAAEDVHSVRIAFKNWRYVLEFFEPLYPGLGKVRSKLAHLQDLLGAFNDACVGAEYLSNLKFPPDSPAAATVAALLEQMAQRRDGARADFAKAWERMNVRRLRRRLGEALW